VPDHLFFTDSEEACALVARNPLALLIGFALDQQITVQKAFAGPLEIERRVGSLDARTLAATDLEPVFKEKPAIHRFPAAKATSVRDLAAHVVESYDGDASRIWTTATNGEELRARLTALPGYGPLTVDSVLAVLAKRFDVAVAREVAPDKPTLGDVDSPTALLDYQAAKRAHKAAAKLARARSA